jgi:hypothetical protein
MGRCEFGKDDYSFNIVNMPTDESIEDDIEIESNIAKSEDKPKKGKKKNAADDSQQELF